MRTPVLIAIMCLLAGCMFAQVPTDTPTITPSPTITPTFPPLFPEGTPGQVVDPYVRHSDFPDKLYYQLLDHYEITPVATATPTSTGTPYTSTPTITPTITPTLTPTPEPTLDPGDDIWNANRLRDKGIGSIDGTALMIWPSTAPNDYCYPLVWNGNEEYFMLGQRIDTMWTPTNTPTETPTPIEVPITDITVEGTPVSPGKGVINFDGRGDIALSVLSENIRVDFEPQSPFNHRITSQFQRYEDYDDDSYYLDPGSAQSMELAGRMDWDDGTSWLSYSSGGRIRSSTTNPALEIRQDSSGDIFSGSDGGTEVMSIEDDGRVTHTATNTSSRSVWWLTPLSAQVLSVEGSSALERGWSSLGGISTMWATVGTGGAGTFNVYWEIPHGKEYGGQYKIRRITAWVYMPASTAYITAHYLFTLRQGAAYRSLLTSYTDFGNGTSGHRSYDLYNNSTGITVSYDEPLFLQLDCTQAFSSDMKIIAVRIEYDRI